MWDTLGYVSDRTPPQNDRKPPSPTPCPLSLQCVWVPAWPSKSCGLCSVRPVWVAITCRRMRPAGAPPQGPTLSRAVSVADAARARADDVIMCAIATMLCHFAHLRARAFHINIYAGARSRQSILNVDGSHFRSDFRCTVSTVVRKNGECTAGRIKLDSLGVWAPTM